jgi:DNA invertase Pin-like site-specific DNA recombinase
MKKAAIYVRVSTPDQHVESQLYDLRELAAQKGYEIVHEYEDRGISGTKARRPGLDALMADARRKKSQCCWLRDLTASPEVRGIFSR